MLLLQVYDCVKQDNNYKAQQARRPDSRHVKAIKINFQYTMLQQSEVRFYLIQLEKVTLGTKYKLTAI